MTENTVEFRLPQMGATMESGTVLQWSVVEGAEIKVGDILLELETDKVALEIESPVDGRLNTIVAAVGTEVLVGDVLAKLETNDVLAPSEKQVEVAQVVAPELRPAGPAAADSEDTRQGRVAASPAARRLAREAGIDLAVLANSLSAARVRSADVLNAIAQTGSAPATTTNSRMRKVIAEQVTISKQTVPHFYLSSSCAMDKVIQTRENLLQSGEYAKHKPTVTDFIIRAVALALKQVPNMNSSWTGADVKLHSSADIGLAVAVNYGVVNVLIPEADEKSLAEIARETAAIRERAKSAKMKSGDFQQGSFTISNLGMYGVQSFTAIIDPPQTGILAVGAIEERPVVRNGVVTSGNELTLTLSVDHRAIDGVVAARFLGAVRSGLEQAGDEGSEII